MTVLQSALLWCKGEIFDSQIIIFIGSIALLLSIIFYKFSESQSAKALILPLVVYGVVLLSSGFFGVSYNQKRIVEFSKAYKENSQTFLQNEKKRVKDFNNIYKQVLIVVSLLLFISLLILWFSSNIIWHGFAIMLLLFSLSAVTIDYFSKERAKNYQNQLYLINNQ